MDADENQKRGCSCKAGPAESRLEVAEAQALFEPISRRQWVASHVPSASRQAWRCCGGASALEPIAIFLHAICLHDPRGARLMRAAGDEASWAAVLGDQAASLESVTWPSRVVRAGGDRQDCAHADMVRSPWSKHRGPRFAL